MTSLTSTPDAEDFRALAGSAPWRFTTLHWTHESGGSATEAWLDRAASRLVVRAPDGEVHAAEGAPYAVGSFSWDEQGRPIEQPRQPADRDAGVARREDGLVIARPDDWHLEHGDPLWQNYTWTAMLDPAELSAGVEVTEVVQRSRGGRLTWEATCRPLVEAYDPRCGCCPLLNSRASRLLEYGPDDPTLDDADLPTAYWVALDVETGIVVDLRAEDGRQEPLVNTIHAVDEPLQVPR